MFLDIDLINLVPGSISGTQTICRGVTPTAIQNTGVALTNARMSFVYKLQLDYNLFLLPSVVLGYTSTSFNLPTLVFEDQINATTGYITTQSDDPLSNQIVPIQYPHFGASFLLHNDIFLTGITLDNLNQPNASMDRETQEKLPIRIGVQAGIEMDINPYQNNFLPNNSYFFLYTAIKKTKHRTDLFFAQDLQLDNFSFGINQHASLVNGFSFNNLGVSMGLSIEHFDLGFQYALPMRKVGVAHPPKVFEVYVGFDFTRFCRNNRGVYKRLQTDNYY